jgi:pimeloyl-ACP methyl ester carboxylesterase
MMSERVDRLVLMDTNLARATPAQRNERDVWSRRALNGSFEDIVERELLPIMTYCRGDLDEVVRSMAKFCGVDNFVSQNRAIARRPDLRPFLSSIRVPTLLLCGQHDKMCPPELHMQLAVSVPGAVLKVIPRAGHLSPLDQPAALSRELLAWLELTETPESRETL